MIKGSIVNNTAKSRHIFKRTVYPGQRVDLMELYVNVSSSLPENVEFLQWVQERLPAGWELFVDDSYSEPVDPKKILESTVELPANKEEKDLLLGEDSPSLEFAPLKVIDKLTAKDIYNLRIKDNPKRVIKQISSVHKLRRALALCKNDSRKQMLSNIIRHRIKELAV